MLQVQNTTTSKLNPNLLIDEGQEPTTRTSELTDQVANTPKKALTSRRAYTTLKTVGNLLSKLADATKPILTKVGIFSEDEKTLDQMIALETKLSDTYGDVKLEKENRKDGIESKNIHALKLTLADLDIPADKALQIVEAYGKKDNDVEFTKEAIKTILGEGSEITDENIDQIIKSVDQNISIRSILAKLVNGSFIGKKTAIVADTLYRLGTKLIAASLLLMSAAVMVATAGFTLPVAVIAIVTALTILAVASNVVKEGVETFKAETKKETDTSELLIEEDDALETTEATDVKTEEAVEKKADKLSLQKAKAKLIEFATTLKAFFAKVKTFISEAKKLIESLKKFDKETDIKAELISTVTAELLGPFKQAAEQYSQLALTAIVAEEVAETA